MKPTVDSPKIVLLDDRSKQSMVFQLNLSIYLDAVVQPVENLKELSEALLGPARVDLVIARAGFRSKEDGESPASFLETLRAEVPVILLGAESAARGVALAGDTDVKPLLQAAAKILGITPRHMVSKNRPDYFQISPAFLSLLFTFPCDVFSLRGLKPEKILHAGSAVDRQKITALALSSDPIFIETLKRVDLANAVTEQSRAATDSLLDEKIPPEEKVGLLSNSMEIVSTLFQHSGMDEETIRLANASIKAMTEIAALSPSLDSLLSQLVAAKSGYRYAHAQIITFLSFHVIKMLGWWDEEQRTTLAVAAFYHDIALRSDEQARVRSPKSAEKLSRLHPGDLEIVRKHANTAATELQASGRVSSDVVRVVLEHHGSKTGLGFGDNLEGLHQLSRIFFLAEEWADYLIELIEGRQNTGHEMKIAELKGQFRDEHSLQIIEALRYVDPEQFAYDFLSTREVEYAAAFQAEPAAGGSAWIEPQKEDSLPGETRITGVTQHLSVESVLVKGEPPQSKDGSGDNITVSGPGGAQDASIIRNFSTGGDAGNAGETRIKEVTEHIGDTGHQTTIKGVTNHFSEEKQIIKGDGSPAAPEPVTVIKADAPAKNPALEVIKIASEPKAREQELKVKALDGSTELMKAALAGNFERVREIVTESKGELRRKDAEGRSPLHYASMGGSVEIIKLMIESGGQINLADSKRRTPLFMAALYQKNEAFDQLLAQGAKAVQQTLGGMTIAMVAASTGNLHVLKAALQNGVRHDSKDHQGKSALDFARAGNQAEAVAFLQSLEKSSARK